jgi:hypothetical protein
VDDVKMDLGEIVRVVCGGFIWFRIEASGGCSCDCSNVLSGHIKCWHAVEWLHN